MATSNEKSEPILTVKGKFLLKISYNHRKTQTDRA